MRVLSFSVDDWVEPATAFEALYSRESHVVWLDSGVHAAEGISVMGTAARVVSASVADGTVTVEGTAEDGTIFDFLRQDLARHQVAAVGGFPLGWIGWLGYELRAQTMHVDVQRKSRYPDAALAFLDRGIVFDHGSHRVILLALGDSWEGELLAWSEGVVQRLDEVKNRRPARPSALASRRSPEMDFAPSSSAPASRRSPEIGVASSSSARIETNWAYTDDQYLDMIRQCQTAIAAGDAYQLCLTTEVSVTVQPDPLETYLALRRSSPTHHGAYLRMGEVSLLSASPEQFLSVSPDGQVQSKPIKGTRRRGLSAEEDARLRDELESSDKERAENLMIVDLMRNDIARIAEIGSVRVTSLLAVESYAQVHQLVSTVRGTLAEGVTGMDAVVSCFPAGSMTGAPKRSATEILDSLEQRPRGIYSGAVGYFGLDGRIDLSMVIRSIVLDANGATVGTGGGITALSVPEEELDEVYLKAAALLDVLGVPSLGTADRPR